MGLSTNEEKLLMATLKKAQSAKTKRSPF